MTTITEENIIKVSTRIYVAMPDRNLLFVRPLPAQLNYILGLSEKINDPDPPKYAELQ